MNILVDTNVLLYAVNRDCEEHARARGFLEALMKGNAPFCVTWSVCYEFLRVSTHPRVFPRPLSAAEALSFLASLIELPQVHVLIPTERHFKVLQEVLAGLPRVAGNFFYDVVNAVHAKEHGVNEIASADTDYHRFTFLTVTDPVHHRENPPS